MDMEMDARQRQQQNTNEGDEMQAKLNNMAGNFQQLRNYLSTRFQGRTDVPLNTNTHQNVDNVSVGSNESWLRRSDIRINDGNLNLDEIDAVRDRETPPPRFHRVDTPPFIRPMDTLKFIRPTK
jgi:hypothetical protein